MKRTLTCLVLLAGCTDSLQSSIDIPFALPATNELSSSSTNCGYAPVTQAGGVYKPSGLLELNPFINPSGPGFPIEYVRGIQVENYLQPVSLVDSNGNVLLGSNANDFHIEAAKLEYLDVEGQLSPVGTVVVPANANVPTGGLQAATAVIVTMVPPSVAQSWQSDFANNPALAYYPDGGLGGNAITSQSPVEDVIVEIQMLGKLGSGASASSGIFHFPLQLCFNCTGLPTTFNVPDCGSGVLGEIGFGPCCAHQDVQSACFECGGKAEPCCPTSNPNGACKNSGSTMLTCTAGTCGVRTCQ